MSIRSSVFIRFSVLAVAVMVLATTSKAQFTIQFGASDAAIKRSLIAKGFTEPKILKRSFKKIRVQACKDGKRYTLRLNPAGRIRNSQEIGNCRKVVSMEQAAAMLERRGFRRVEIERQAEGYVAVVCQDGERFRLQINRFGDVSNRQYVGFCRQGLAPKDIAALLRKQGYNRIKFTDDKLPRYVAEACRANSRVELLLSYRGRIRNEQRIGTCAPPIDPDDLPQILAKRGFNRVEVIDDKLPRYIVEACRGTDRFELALNRFGEITDRFELDRCPPPITREQLANALLKQGYTRTSIQTADDGGYDVRSCTEGRRSRIFISKFGVVLDRRDLSPCKAPSLDAITDRLGKRGLSKVEYFVEGCRRGRRIRIQLNDFGEPIGRERIGPC